MSVASALALTIWLSVEPAKVTFDHEAFCKLMNFASFHPGVQDGLLVDKNIRHGGVSVNCEQRSVEVRTVLLRPLKTMGRQWLPSQMSYWSRDHCRKKLFAEAVAHGWTLSATVLVDAQIVASFRAVCFREQTTLPNTRRKRPVD